MTERDCNTCKHHVQGASLDDAPSRCWNCSNTSGPLHGWEPFEEARDAPVDLPVPRRVLLTDHQKAPEEALKTQVGGSHYKDFKIQPIEFCMMNGLNACQSKVIKYVTRKKGDLKKKLEDIDKAIHVLGIYKELLSKGDVADAVTA